MIQCHCQITTEENLVGLYLWNVFVNTAFWQRYDYPIKFFTMQQGKIARLTDRGFGFISRDGEEKDLFFHSNELKDVDFNSLNEGDTVEFEVTQGNKGPNAVNVSKV